MIVAIVTVTSSSMLSTGALPNTRPQQPMRGIAPLLTRTLVLSARVMDAVTDMSFFRILVAEVLPLFVPGPKNCVWIKRSIS
jgi:hypothetical protein